MWKYTTSPPPPFSPTFAYYTNVFHTFAYTFHKFTYILTRFAYFRWMIRKNEGYLWKIYKEVVSVKKRSVSWTRAFSKTFPSLSPSRKKKKNKTSRILLSKNDNKPKMYLSEFLYILYYFYESIGIMHCA